MYISTLKLNKINKCFLLKFVLVVAHFKAQSRVTHCDIDCISDNYNCDYTSSTCL